MKERVGVEANPNLNYYPSIRPAWSRINKKILRQRSRPSLWIGTNRIIPVLRNAQEDSGGNSPHRHVLNFGSGLRCIASFNLLSSLCPENARAPGRQTTRWTDSVALAGFIDTVVVKRKVQNNCAYVTSEIEPRPCDLMITTLYLQARQEVSSDEDWTINRELRFRREVGFGLGSLPSLEQLRNAKIGMMIALLRWRSRIRNLGMVISFMLCLIYPRPSIHWMEAFNFHQTVTV
jgi:hypothetical protein